jgi:steroid delta-isomerase-like uncharacterized protein
MTKTAMTQVWRNSLVAFAIAIATVFALPAISVAQTRSKAPSSTDKKTIEQLFAAWSSHDPDKLANLFGKDAVYEDVTADHISRGSAEVRKWAAGGFSVFENFKMEVASISVHNGRGVAEWVWTATDKKLGKNFSVRGVSIIEVRGGKISRCKDYYDFATAMRQMGLLPAQE